MILRISFRWIFTAIVVLVGVVFGPALGTGFFRIISLFDPDSALSINSDAFSLVALGELSQIAVRWASSAVNTEEAIADSVDAVVGGDFFCCSAHRFLLSLKWLFFAARSMLGHWPGYFLPVHWGANSPSLYLCQEILIIAQKKKAADLCDQ